MEEYEKSFQVDDIQPFLDYCKDNNFNFVYTVQQNRKVFENKHNRNIIARITRNQKDDTTEIIFDCKNCNRKNVNLTISQESAELLLSESSEKVMLSILSTIDFELVADNFRTRYVFVKDNIKFEIDNYTSPSMKIVAIEGEQSLVDETYKNIQSKLGKHNLTNAS